MEKKSETVIKILIYRLLTSTDKQRKQLSLICLTTGHRIKSSWWTVRTLLPLPVVASTAELPRVF